MQKKKLDVGFQMPQSSVVRVGRKVIFTGDVDEDTYGELAKILFEIESEDEDGYYQYNAEVTLNGVANALESDSEKLTKDEEKNMIDIINKYKKSIKTQNVLEKEPIQLYVNSYGGSLHDCFGIVDLIRNLKTPVHTYCFGKCMSAGFIIFICGDKRFISRNSRAMLHQLASSNIGKYQDLVESLDENTILQEMMEDLVLLHTYIDEDFLEEIKYRKLDCYFNADECIELGIADEII